MTKIVDIQKYLFHVATYVSIFVLDCQLLIYKINFSLSLLTYKYELII